MKKVFICWKPFCTRSHNQAKHFDAKEIYIFYFGNKQNYFSVTARYFLSFFATLKILYKEKPDVIFTLNQPPLLILSVYLYTELFGGYYILDSHSGAFNDKKWKWALPLYRFIASRAFLNINTNVHHQKIVESWGGRSVIISDIPIDHAKCYPVKEVHPNSIAVVASFMFDEPIDEIWQAAKKTPRIHYYVTGNYKKLPPNLLDNTPPNIHLTGFISNDEYFGLLSAAKGIMVLTTRDHTMQRGAYEALSLQQPIITSDWSILRESFGDSAIYVDNSAAAIVKGVRQLFANLNQFKMASMSQKLERRAYFDEVKNSILAKLQQEC